MSLWTSSPARADDRLTVRGNYYREESTRVLQPMVSFTKDLADRKIELGVDYLLDAISSASIAAGAEALGGDVVFTEYRHEANLQGRVEFGTWQLSGGFGYSTETDYISRSARIGLQKSLANDTVQLSGGYAVGFNSVFQVRNNIGDRLEHVSSGDTNLLHTHQWSLGYSQVLTPVWLAGLSFEGMYAQGPQDNPYRRALNGRPETHPWVRKRLAASGWSKIALPPARMVFEPRYRFYADDWGVDAHSIDLRVHFRVWNWLRIRLRYRFYTQSGADFFPGKDGYPADAVHVTADPKLAAWLSHTPGLQLTWELDGLAARMRLKWLMGAWVQATYNHVFQTSSFGDARLGSLAFSLPF